MKSGVCQFLIRILWTLRSLYTDRMGAISLNSRRNKKFCSLILLIYRHELILSIKFIDWNDVIASRHFVMVISVIALNKFKYSKCSNNNCRFLVYESLKGARISHWDMALCVNLHFTNKNKSETQRNITWKMRRFLLNFLIVKRK